MSKRFGRNQKRAMRQQLDNKEFAIAGLKRRGEYLENQVRRNEGLIDCILEIVPKHFCALEAAELNDVSMGTRSIDIPILPKSYRALWAMEQESPQIVGRLYATLDIMRAHIERDIDPLSLQKMVHVRLTYGGKHMGYAINEKCFKHMPIEELALNLARILKDAN